MIILTLSNTAPDNPPQNVTATAVSSTKIEISWEDLRAICQNGVITMYEILYEPLETFGGQITSDTVNTSNGSVLMMVLSDLEEYVEYIISVRAYTSTGPGPYSDPVTERTLEDGEKLDSSSKHGLSCICCLYSA